MMVEIAKGHYSKAVMQVMFFIYIRFVQNNCSPVPLTHHDISVHTGLSERQIRRALTEVDKNVRSITKSKVSGGSYKYKVDIEKFGAIEQPDKNVRGIYNSYYINKEESTPDKNVHPGTEPEVKRFTDHFYKQYRDRYNASPDSHVPKKDRAKNWQITVNMSRSLINEYGTDKLITLTNLFFDMDDDWLNRVGRTLNTFRSQIPKLLEQQKNKKQLDAKEAWAEWDGQP